MGPEEAEQDNTNRILATAYEPGSIIMTPTKSDG